VVCLGWRINGRGWTGKRKIRTAAVLGSGVMGDGIAAILAGADVKTLLLDIVPFDRYGGRSGSSARRPGA
jgi:3-hydroxyacyl-CoA dehydrogenase